MNVCNDSCRPLAVDADADAAATINKKIKPMFMKSQMPIKTRQTREPTKTFP